MAHPLFVIINGISMLMLSYFLNDIRCLHTHQTFFLSYPFTLWFALRTSSLPLFCCYCCCCFSLSAADLRACINSTFGSNVDYITCDCTYPIFRAFNILGKICVHCIANMTKGTHEIRFPKYR